MPIRPQMGYAKKSTVVFALLVSLIWLTAAVAKPGNGEANGKDRSGQTGNGNGGSGNNGNGNGQGASGSPGPRGTTGGQGQGQDGGQSGKPEEGVSMGAEPTGRVKVKLPGSAKA